MALSPLRLWVLILRIKVALVLSWHGIHYLYSKYCLYITKIQEKMVILRTARIKMSAIVWSNHKPKVGRRYSNLSGKKQGEAFHFYLVNGEDDGQKMISFMPNSLDSKMLELCSFHVYKILYNHKKRTTRFIIAFFWEQSVIKNMSCYCCICGYWLAVWWRCVWKFRTSLFTFESVVRWRWGVWITCL